MKFFEKPMKIDEVSQQPNFLPSSSKHPLVGRSPETFNLNDFYIMKCEGIWRPKFFAQLLKTPPGRPEPRNLQFE